MSASDQKRPKQRAVPFVPFVNAALAPSDVSGAVADQLNQRIAEWAADGWSFSGLHRVETHRGVGHVAILENVQTP